VRQQLGESPRSVQQFDVPLEQATTRSFDALVAYSKANAMLSSVNAADAIPLLDRAIALDPNFALAYSSRGSVLYNRQEIRRAVEDYAKAYSLSDGISEREKLRITAAYYRNVDDDLERAADTYKLWAGLYPRDNVPWENLANIYIRMGRYPESVAAAQHGPTLDPGSLNAYVTLARAQKKANLYEDAKSTCREAFGNGLDSWHLHSILFQIAYAQKDNHVLSREVAWDKGKPTESATLDNQAYAAGTGGRIQAARELFRSAIEASRRDRLEDFPNAVLMDESQVDLFAGFLREARSNAEKVPLDQDIETSTQAGIAAALSGGTAYAAAVIARLRKEPRHSVLREQVDIPMVEASLAIERKNPSEAVKLLEPAQVYELRDYIIPFLRGRAYLDAKIPQRAVTEYRAITANPGIDPVSPMYPLAFLGLGRAYSQQGKRLEGIAAYERFFDLWKDADANVPVLLDARREYASLKSN
jgi:tetratricopeptide (TPR) repeat protein